MPKATTVLLDTNAYYRLEDDAGSRKSLLKGIAKGKFRLIATPVVIDELQKGPLAGPPGDLPVEQVPEAVAVVGHARVGAARIGDGKVFREHRGESQKTKDAIIADSAHHLADWFVSDDNRCRHRLEQISDTCEPITFDEFRGRLS